MDSRAIGGLTLFFDREEREAADLIGSACERSVAIMRELWGLEDPGDCRVYVMTSWLRFVFHSAPWPWRLYWAVTLPVRYAYAQKLWEVAGGWSQRYGQRRAVGVKPPRLLRQAKSAIGQRIFTKREIDDSVQHNTCHELVHAFTDHLGLPAWLREGLAMVTVDRFAGTSTVRDETLEVLVGPSPGSWPDKTTADPRHLEHIVSVYVRGYWLTRYLAETRPELLRRLLERPQPGRPIEDILAAELGLGGEECWREIDQVVAAYFGRIQELTPGCHASISSE